MAQHVNYQIAKGLENLAALEIHPQCLELTRAALRKLALRIRELTKAESLLPGPLTEATKEIYQSHRVQIYALRFIQEPATEWERRQTTAEFLRVLKRISQGMKKRSLYECKDFEKRHSEATCAANAWLSCLAMPVRVLLRGSSGYVWYAGSWPQ